MNKVLIVGRLTRDPDVQETNSGIKYSRFTVAVSKQFAENQADFIPITAWRSQAEFIEKYVRKGGLVSVEGRFSSSTYQNADGQNVTRYEVAADRVEALETKAQVDARTGNAKDIKIVPSASDTQFVEFAKESKPEEIKNDVPWELDL